MLRKIVTVLKYIARVCVALIHVVVGKKDGDCICNCADETLPEKDTETDSETE